jgi:hypothetical protein
MQSSEARTYEQAEVRKGRPQPRHLVLILLLLIAVALLACYIPGAPRDPRGSVGRAALRVTLETSPRPEL